MAISEGRSVVGVVGSLPFDPFQYCILAAGTAIAWAYCLELTLLTFYTFRRWSGLYFCSLLISSWGCIFHALGFVLKFLTHTPPKCFLIFIEIGWVAMVTGQSFVLYSRLHLVVRRRRTLHLVLAMIITDGVLLHTPTIVLTIGSNGPSGRHWAPIFNIMERIQLAMFCIQEFLISTVYIVYTLRLLGSIYHSRTRAVMIQLVVINSVCLSMDVVLIGLEYSNNYVGETSVKAMIYSIKLKLEFMVLNQLMSLMTQAGGMTEEGRGWSRRRRSSGRNGGHGVPGLEKQTSFSMAPGVRSVFDRGSRGSLHHELKPNRIARTQRIEVVSEPMSAVQARGKKVDVAGEGRGKGIVGIGMNKPFSLEKRPRVRGDSKAQMWSHRQSQSMEETLKSSP